MSVDERWRALEEENTRLRNSLIASNDEIFTLRAVAASVEAEIKYSAEQELTKIGSELKFRSKELESLSKEHERVLRELKQLRQQEVENRNRVTPAPVASARENSDHSQYSADSGPPQSVSQSNRTSATLPAARREAADPSKAGDSTAPSGLGDIGHSRSVSPRPAEARATAANSAQVTHLVPLYTPPSVVPELSSSTTLTAQFEQLLCVVAQAGRYVSEGGGIEPLVNKATIAVRTALVQARSVQHPSAMLDAFDAVLHIGTVLLHSLQSDWQANALSAGKLVPILKQTVTVLGTLAPHGLLTAKDAHSGGDGTGSGPHRVAGSLQSKFERAATVTATATATTTGTATSSTTLKGSAPRLPTDLVSAAMTLPALTEAQLRLADPETDRRVDRSSYSGPDANVVIQLAGRYYELLSGVIALCGEYLPIDETHVSWSGLFTATASAAISFYRSSSGAGSRHLSHSDDLVDHSGEQSWEGVFSSMVMVVTLQMRGAGRLCRDYGVAAAAVQLWQAALQSSDGAMTSFVTWEATAIRDAGSGTRDGELGRGSLLSALVDGVAAPLLGDSSYGISYSCTVVQCFLMALEHSGPAFVRVFLGIAESSAQPFGKGRQQSVSRRKRARAEADGEGEERDGEGEGGGGGDSSSLRSGHSGSSSSDLTRIAAAGEGASRGKAGGLEQTGGTPVPARKAGNRLGRMDSTVTDPSATGAGAVARITPSTHGSGGGGGRSSGRKVAVAVIVVDLRDQQARLHKRHLTGCMQAWMRAVRYLDTCTGSRPSTETERQVVRLVHLLGSFLGAFLDHLRPQDCDEVLSDAADVVHEYIHRCNTASWSPALKVSDSLFAFLEGRPHESSA